jgi:hypothetical protein
MDQPGRRNAFELALYRPSSDRLLLCVTRLAVSPAEHPARQPFAPQISRNIVPARSGVNVLLILSRKVAINFR